ncbi:MAG: small subunit ribosomal protein [Patescibacteria group bacterium]|jgi:small subunit ribosomal protein S13|nr:small subunit ribosomal protein [Patescibacteria group bacterium]MDQ5970592.1 small subunit ribosomal protein [Patescibacteria group bacterium]
MARISGVNLPNEKRIEVALTSVYGIGLSSSNKILKMLKIDPNIRVKALSEEQVNTLRQVIEKDYRVEGELRREKMTNIKRLKEIKCYRGTRHTKGLPVRGQRTKSNNRTIRGNKRVTMGSGRVSAAQKT